MRIIATVINDFNLLSSLSSILCFLLIDEWPYVLEPARTRGLLLRGEGKIGKGMEEKGVGGVA